MSAGPVKPVEGKHLALNPIVDGAVDITEGFWGVRQTLNREVTIPHGMKMLEESGTIENFRIAAGSSRAEYQMPLFRDSDLYKVLEAIAWERARGGAADQEGFFASSVEVIAAAQEHDGYVNSYVQVLEDGHRFGNPAMGHELYCAGHLMQASVADTRTNQGPGTLAGIANRFASLLVRTLSSEHADYVPGHPEIEMALVELYRTNSDARLVDLAADLIRRRGRASLSWHMFRPPYFQDDIAFDDATTVRGHAVRALYLLTGATDLYTETGRPRLLRSVLAQWHDMFSTKTYVTGGVGSRHKDEAFGDAYELPPDRAYCETCAAIVSIMWNWRLLLVTGHAVYAELMERTLYNGFLASVGLDGRSFFYVNPLQAREPSARQAWYECACCPPNIMRLLASLQHYIATRTEQGVQVHQYATGRIRSEQAAGALEIAVTAGYPYDGTIAIRCPGRTELLARDFAARAVLGRRRALQAQRAAARGGAPRQGLHQAAPGMVGRGRDRARVAFAGSRHRRGERDRRHAWLCGLRARTSCLLHRGAGSPEGHEPVRRLGGCVGGPKRGTGLPHCLRHGRRPSAEWPCAGRALSAWLALR